MPSTKLRFKVADELERASAVDLQRQLYEKELGFAPDDARTPGAHYLVAVNERDLVVGTARFVGPEHRPFEIEEYVDLSGIFPPDRTIALGGRLCVRPGHRRLSESIAILIGLLRLTSDIGAKEGWTDVLIYPRAALVEFYRGALFEEVGRTFVDPRFGITMHLMRLELARLHQRLETSGAALDRLLAQTRRPGG